MFCEVRPTDRRNPLETLRSETVPVRTEEDVIRVRQLVRERSAQAGFGLVDQTKIVTAASELARNTVVHGGGGELLMEMARDGRRTGLRLTFQDKGPGIADLNLAMKDGYTSIGGLGLGLGGAKRLSNEFEIQSRPGEGTRVCIARWK